MFLTIAQAAATGSDFTGWSNLTATSAIIGIVVWLVTKGFPGLLERHDRAQAEARVQYEKAQTDAREHFEKILDKIETRRGEAAKDGHDAARKLAEAVSAQVGAIDRNSAALAHLAEEVKSAHV